MDELIFEDPDLPPESFIQGIEPGNRGYSYSSEGDEILKNI